MVAERICLSDAASLAGSRKEPSLCPDHTTSRGARASAGVYGAQWMAPGRCCAISAPGRAAPAWHGAAASIMAATAIGVAAGTAVKAQLSFSSSGNRILLYVNSL